MTVLNLRATTALIPLVFLAAPAAGQTSQPPVVITPPVGDFSLPPSGQTPTPRPTAAPTPTPTSAPIVQPIPIPQPTPTPVAPSPRATAPRRAQAPAATAVTPIMAGTPTPAPSLSPSPIAPTTVQAAPTPSATATPAAEPGLPAWFWPALGGVALLVAGGLAGWWIGRRRRAREDAIEDEVTVAPPPPVAPPVPTPGPPPLVRKTPPDASMPPASPPPAPAPVAPVAPPDGPLVAEIRPLRAAIRDGQVTLDFELFVQNRGHEPADNIRAVLALLGANAEQDAQIARFHSAARLATGSEPFSVAPGAVHKLNAQVSLPGEQMQVVTVQGKAMFVPIIPLALKWYAGLSIRTLRDSFMIGTAPAPGNDKLGPLWVERAADGFGRLAAKRYVAKAGA
ncbi:hypothetical protein OK349_15715 [Sphingomonas sp. BT-65]|uniref:hypothetical protein n=1 Tax=Sphingomonas sp. BT-65 TaxID=2989821 RepID=UPI002235D4C5|nr:hypothetical protein [Sphingomonas sp. BT-65]MCW4463159.1 hypothetical protein [Sphingomonas sp. BT-65]